MRFLVAWWHLDFYFPNSLIYIYALIPIKAKWAVLAYVLFELFSGIQNTAGDNVAHWAHLGRRSGGLLLVLYWRKTDRRNFTEPNWRSGVNQQEPRNWKDNTRRYAMLKKTITAKECIWARMEMPWFNCSCSTR